MCTWFGRCRCKRHGHLRFGYSREGVGCSGNGSANDHDRAARDRECQPAQLAACIDDGGRINQLNRKVLQSSTANGVDGVARAEGMTALDTNHHDWAAWNRGHQLAPLDAASAHYNGN